MIRIPVPCQHHPAGGYEAKFDPGARFCDEREECVAVVRIPETDRQHGLGELLHNAYHRGHHEIELVVARRRELSATLEHGWLGRFPCPLKDGEGVSRGRMELKLSWMRIPVAKDRVVLHDEFDRELGFLEFEQKLTTNVTRIEDVAAGIRYPFERRPGAPPNAKETPMERMRRYLACPPMIYGDGAARDIDARFLLAVSYYFDFVRDASGPHPL